MVFTGQRVRLWKMTRTISDLVLQEKFRRLSNNFFQCKSNPDSVEVCSFSIVLHNNRLKMFVASAYILAKFLGVKQVLQFLV